MAPLMSLRAALVAMCLIVSEVKALHFFIDGTTPKCFYEELARDTLVVGMRPGKTGKDTV
jgi:hypothetical protein